MNPSTRKSTWIKLLAGLGLVAVSLAVRLPLYGRDLPYYEIDENDIVEPALAALSGDWEPYRYQYGPIYAWMLAVLFRVGDFVTSVFLGWDSADFFYRAFFDPSVYYFIARVSHTLVICAIAGLLYRFASSFWGNREGIVALALGLSPLLDLTTEPAFTVRIDSLLALFCLFSLYYAARFGPDDENGLRNYILAGLFCGFGIAVKPLNGILLLPVLWISYFMVFSSEKVSLVRRTSLFFKRREPWMIVFSAFGGAVLANPYSLLRVGQFTAEQRDVILGKITRVGFYPGYDLSWLFGSWGAVLALVFILVVLLSVRSRDHTARLLVIWILFYFILFLPFQIRTYWYSPVVTALCLLVSKYTVDLSKRDIFKRYRVPELAVTSLLTLIMVAYPWYEMAGGVRLAMSAAPAVEKRADMAAEAWIHKHIPAGEGIFLVGWYSINLPRLVASDIGAEARWSERFMYGRHLNDAWLRKFSTAYTRYLSEGRPAYRLENVRINYRDDSADNPQIRNLMRNLDMAARQKGYKYVVTASPSSYTGPWESREGVTLLSRFSRDEGYLRDEVKIFSVR